MKRDATPLIQLEVPPGFTGLPVGAPADGPRAGARYPTEVRRRELAADIAADCGPHARELLSYLSALAGIAAPHRLRLFGHFAAGDGGPREGVFANLAVTVPALRVSDFGTVRRIARDPLTTAKLLRTRYRERHPYADVSVVQLGIGPAMVVSSAGEYRLPPKMTGSPETVVRHRVKAEFQIPAPGGTHLIVMTVSSDNEAGWPSVAGTAMRVANSIRCAQHPPEPGCAGTELAVGGRNGRRQ